MSSVGESRSGVDALGDAGAAQEEAAAAVGRATAIGRVVSFLAPPLMVLHAAVWLLLGAGGFRTVLAFACTSALALCPLALFAARASSPRMSGVAAYRSAWRGSLSGSRERWWRLILPGFVVPAYVALSVGMGAAALDEPNDAERIAAAGAQVVATSVKEAQQLGKTGKGRLDDYRAIYDVRIPGHSGVSVGSERRTVRVEVLSNEYLRRGATLYVAYAPSDPDLTPVADEERSQVQQQLSGRAMTFRMWVVVLVAWVAGTVALTAWLMRGGVGHRPGARVKRMAGGAWRVPAEVKGHMRYVPRGNSAGGFQGLGLRIADREIPVEFVGCSPKLAAEALRGQTGQLEWWTNLPSEPEEHALAKAPADFVAADGKRLAGDVPVRLLQQLSTHPSAQFVPSAPASRGATASVVDLGAAWPLTVHPASLVLALVALALPVPVYLVTNAGSWGLALVLGGAASAVAALLVNFYRSFSGLSSSPAAR